jgi:hypothetical protein
MMQRPTDMWNDDNAIYDDGEWITWTEINSHLDRLEFEHRFPHLDVDLVPIFQDLLAVAQDYYGLTGSHLQVSCTETTLKDRMERSETTLLK